MKKEPRVYIESSSGRFAREYKNVGNHMGLIFVRKCNKYKEFKWKYTQHDMCVSCLSK